MKMQKRVIAKPTIIICHASCQLVPFANVVSVVAVRLRVLFSHSVVGVLLLLRHLGIVRLRERINGTDCFQGTAIQPAMTQRVQRKGRLLGEARAGAACGHVNMDAFGCIPDDDGVQTLRLQ